MAFCIAAEKRRAKCTGAKLYHSAEVQNYVSAKSYKKALGCSTMAHFLFVLFSYNFEESKKRKKERKKKVGRAAVEANIHTPLLLPETSEYAISLLIYLIEFEL